MRGQIWLVDFEGNVGNEQRERRPAIIVSAREFNQTTNLVWVVPITQGGEFSRAAGFTVPMIGCRETNGVARCEQLTSIDLKARDARYLETAPDHIVDCVIAKLLPILE